MRAPIDYILAAVTVIVQLMILCIAAFMAAFMLACQTVDSAMNTLLDLEDE